jgi:hypothetical protein
MEISTGTKCKNWVTTFAKFENLKTVLNTSSHILIFNQSQDFIIWLPKYAYMWINFLALSLTWFLLGARLSSNHLCLFNELSPLAIRNKDVELGCRVLGIPLTNKYCCLPCKTFKFKSKCNCKVGTSMVVFLIPMNTSSIKSTKFACVVD